MSSTLTVTNANTTNITSTNVTTTNIKATGETVGRAVKGVNTVTCSLYHNSGTPTVVDSTNVSSLTDQNTGQANVNYTSNMLSTAYVTACAGWAYSTWSGGAPTAVGSYATTSLLLGHRENGNLVDATAITSPLSCVVTGDLA